MCKLTGTFCLDACVFHCDRMMCVHAELCILVVQVGFENTSYLVAEDAGSVSVCVTVTGQLARDIVVTLSTADGTAIGNYFLHS